VAFEVSGSAAGVNAAVQLLAVRGRLVIVGIHSQPREIDLFRFFWRELTMAGARVYDRADYVTAIDLVHRGHVPADALISRIEPLENAAAAFAALENGGGVMKVLIDCRGESA
jgi:threonine dehydrogenase-like Zn-dependent dehydrogenase